ncbi:MULTISPECIES: thioesterase family protein [unclassified Variovorax]|uniref:thioesterase family protein n=1 Tax=unclassified Variovorax TaxID=663243 RepID=UPI002575E695|nr:MULTISPECIES: thioesterase family protein [unclassified Variovorax]MDM0090973.1 thioesterase family protein [Variovorax sp. J22G40]MDM0149025.1 thioesterase family protein [Variovorax sp. J2P1-31]
MTPTTTAPEDSRTAVYTGAGDAWQPSALSRGPWDPRAQHGGAPCGLLAHVAERAAPGPGWQLTRLTVELVRPVPVAPLVTRTQVQASRATVRVGIELLAGEVCVARAHALLLARNALALPTNLPGWPPAPLRPLPRDCSERLRIPGLPDSVSFYGSAVESRLAEGDATQPGPGGAWFRLAVPLVQGVATSPVMRAAAAADFGNGLSWVLPPDRFLFTNADMSLNLFRAPEGEWIGLRSATEAHGDGVGLVVSRLYDERGPIGIATQTLVLRERAAT